MICFFMVIVIGIETTAHTFGVAVIKDGKVFSNVRDIFTTEKGGLIPLEVRKHHERVAPEIYSKALLEAGIKEEEIEAISFSNAPGLAPCLIAGMEFVKTRAKELSIPVVCVNHCIAHLEIGDLFGACDPVMLYASGANTQIIAYESGKYRVFGETLDLGVGNFIDTIARFMGLGFPGGPKIQKLAEGGEKLIELPYSIKGMDVSFSGIQTKLKTLLDKGEKKEDLAYSLQEYVFAMLVEAAERALAHTGKKELLLGGGVACNSRLQEMCKIMCEARGVKYICPDKSFLVDNAGMIGYLGHKMFLKDLYYDVENLDVVDISPRERTDDVVVNWK
jgi:N6-L-threonylcarbamoyladenine synthase